MATPGATKVDVRTPEGVKSYKLEDVRPYFLFDTNAVLNGNALTEFFFFRTPEGKSTVETNMTQFSSIQQGWIFDVKRIRMMFNNSISLADAKTMYNGADSKGTTVSYLKEGDIEIFSLPTEMLNAGCGLSGATTETATSFLSAGLPSQSSVLQMPFPLTIYGGRTFQFKLKYNAAPNPTATVRLKMVLEGILRREIVGA